MNQFDVIVVGGGHAGYEAAYASSRMGCKTLLITMDVNKVGTLSCNPAIGGTAKGHLVKEIDALGGMMGVVTDETGIQFRMLNKSRGPAVWSPRAQVDRSLYPVSILKRLSNTENLSLLSETVIGITSEKSKVSGVIVSNGEKIISKTVILTCGTFLNGLIHIGLKTFKAGRYGENPVNGLTECLNSLGLESGRLKTGTPARIHKDSIDYSKCQPQKGDLNPEPFSWQTEKITNEQVPCFLTHTNLETHDILRSGFNQSPLFTGRIKGKGPRYCPSIEDKINRFSDKDQHQIFLEPEGYLVDEYYVNGFSTSLPEEIQEKALRSISGLENVKILRFGYAIEYDFFPPYQIKLNLESKAIESLFFAGQINGTSGYEEAAAQGLIAGVNAALKIMEQDPLILKRSEAYIGVLIDDLVNKSTSEPYRIFTSLAEYRLLLRQDNADLRLTEIGRNAGLISDKQFDTFSKKKNYINKVKSWISEKVITPSDVNEILSKTKSSPIEENERLEKILKRPEVSLELISSDNKNLIPDHIQQMIIYRDVLKEIDTSIRYEGYLSRQQDQVEKFDKLENKKIPAGIDYLSLKSMSSEAKEKFSRIRPENIGQASRIPGITPADISLLIVYIEKWNR